MFVFYSLLSSLRVLYCPVVDLGWWQSGWNTLKALSHLSTWTLMSHQQTDRQTERVHTHTSYIYTPVSNEALKQNAITSNCLSEKKKKLSGRDDSRLYCSNTRGGCGFLLSCTVCLAMDFLNRICTFWILASLDTNMTDMHQTTWDWLHLFYYYFYFFHKILSYGSAFIKTGPYVQMLYYMHVLLW